MNHTPHGTQQKPGKQSKQQHPVKDENHNTNTQRTKKKQYIYALTKDNPIQAK